MKKILVATKDKKPFQFIEKTLPRNDFKLIKAQSGDEACHLSLSQNPEIIILHQNLGDMSAIDCCENIKNIGALSLTPVFLMTEHGSHEYANKAYQKQADWVFHYETPKIKIQGKAYQDSVPQEFSNLGIAVDNELKMEGQNFRRSIKGFHLHRDGIFVKADFSIPPQTELFIAIQTPWKFKNHSGLGQMY